MLITHHFAAKKMTPKKNIACSCGLTQLKTTAKRLLKAAAPSAPSQATEIAIKNFGSRNSTHNENILRTAIETEVFAARKSAPGDDVATGKVKLQARLDEAKHWMREQRFRSIFDSQKYVSELYQKLAALEAAAPKGEDDDL